MGIPASCWADAPDSAMIRVFPFQGRRLARASRSRTIFFVCEKTKGWMPWFLIGVFLHDLMIFLPQIHKFHTFFLLNTKLANLLLGFLLGKWFVQVICFYFLSVAFLAMYRCPFFTFDMILRYLKQNLCFKQQLLVLVPILKCCISVLLDRNS